MSATKAAEMVIHHTQAASYFQGKEEAYGMAMRLVRNIVQATAAGRSPVEIAGMLERTEAILYDAAQEAQTKKDKRNKAVREAAEMLVAADNALR